MPPQIFAVISRLSPTDTNEFMFVSTSDTLALPGGQSSDEQTSPQNFLIASIRDRLGIEITPQAQIDQSEGVNYWLCYTTDTCYTTPPVWLSHGQILANPYVPTHIKSFFEKNFV